MDFDLPSEALAIQEMRHYFTPKDIKLDAAYQPKDSSFRLTSSSSQANMV